MQPAQTSPLDCMREIRFPTIVGALSRLSQIPTPPSLMRLSATRQWTPLLNPMPNQFEPLILLASMLAPVRLVPWMAAKGRFLRALTNREPAVPIREHAHYAVVY